MILSGLKYTRSEGEPKEWCIEGNGGGYVSFTNINLFVGKNASGKSRTLTAIREIASLMAGVIKLKDILFSAQSFDLLFEERIYKSDDEQDFELVKYRYVLKFKTREVISELLYKADKLCFERDKDGVKSECADLLAVGKTIDKQELLIHAKDADGVLLFANLIGWGTSLRNYLFADQFEKRAFIEDLSAMKDLSKNKEVAGILLFTFCLGKEQFGDKFVADILQSMHALGYTEITNIDVVRSSKGLSLSIEEDGAFQVSQADMSQGMFRSLSLFIFIIYARLKKISACILIDDIGEGIDFDKSKKLIGQIIRRLQNSSVQCFMSTNDRYVMNDIPLRFWVVIDRHSTNKSVLYDSKNAKEVYEDFKFTGLNNFEFLTTDFYKEGFGVEEEDVDDEEKLSE